MALKIYKIRTTDGNRYAIGVFSGGELLAGGSPRYYKTRRGAERALINRFAAIKQSAIRDTKKEAKNLKRKYKQLDRQVKAVKP